MAINTGKYKGKIAVLIFFLSLSFCCKADDFVIVEGARHASIVIGKNASPTEQYAAGELQRAIRLMSGVTLEIADAVPAGGTSIIIGTPNSDNEILSLAKELKLDGANEEQIALYRKANILYLAGKTPRAALYATYTFLEDVLGVRWFWPGESGEFIPKKNTITVGKLFISESPALEFRALAITGTRNGDPDTDTWMARNKINNISMPPNAYAEEEKTDLRRQKGFLTHISGHNIVLPDSLLKEHPEYIAELGGKRIFQPGSASQLCWSNPGVQDAIAKMMGSWWDRNPFLDAIHFYPADNQRYCQCAQCKAMGDVSTRWQKFSSIVMAKLEQTHPGKKYWTYAYQGYKSVPLTTPAPFEYIGYTLYDASYRHLLSSGNAYNRLPLAEIKGWLDKGAHLGIRGYEYIIFKDPMFVPLVSWVTDEMRWIKDNNLVGYASELPPYGSPKKARPENTYWNGSRMALYAAAKAMWNTNLTADSIVKDWCTTIYGPGASAMNDYYWEMDKAWRNASGKISLFKNSPAPEVDKFLSPEIFEDANHYFTEARTQIESLDKIKKERIEEQISLEGKMLANWQTVYRYKKGTGGLYKTQIVKLPWVNDSVWQSLSKLATTPEKSVEAGMESTEVLLGWTRSALALRIICHDKNGSAKHANHQGENAVDDHVEVYIQPDPDKAAFMQFVVNKKGARHDAFSNGGANFNEAWNPEWSANTIIQKNGWTATIQIPFSSIGIDPRDSSQFKIAVKHFGGVHSGWPDASDLNSANFALATLVNKKINRVDRKIILFDSGVDGGNLSVEFQQQGWEVAAAVSTEKELKQKMEEDAAVILLRFSDKTWNLSDAFLGGEIRTYIEKGGIVIFSAAADLPVDRWFSVAPLKWTGTSNTLVRKSSFVLNGKWLVQPNDLRSVLRNSLTPSSAFVPLAGGWNVLAKIDLKDGQSQPFLLTKQIGNGLLVVTSSLLGYGGGYEMFGNRNMTNVVKLMENLQAAVKSQSGLIEAN